MELANTFTAIEIANLNRGQVSLVIHPHPTLHGQLLTLAADLAVNRHPAVNELQPVHLLVLDGGNCFNVYPVARHLYSRTREVSAVLARIHAARAFTCFEMATLLKDSAKTGDKKPIPSAVLVLDLLSTFRDENIPLKERQRLLNTCLPELHRIAAIAPLLVCSRPADPCLTQILLQAADQVLELELPPIPPEQMRLPFDQQQYDQKAS